MAHSCMAQKPEGQNPSPAQQVPESAAPGKRASPPTPAHENQAPMARHLRQPAASARRFSWRRRRRESLAWGVVIAGSGNALNWDPPLVTS